ncbi:MAG: hypothetical protein JXA57_03795, partial [Armatimonadetes bacterium]|nr:hypothetical protein [Armatimonadota bacterium]
YGLSRGEGYTGTLGLAVPIFDDGGNVTAALQLAAPIQRDSDTNIERWLSLLRKASQDATGLLYLTSTVEGRDLPLDARRAESGPRVVAPAEGGKKYRVV